MDEPVSADRVGVAGRGERERLAYIVTRAHHGGAQVHLAALLDHFRHHYDVHLATGEEGYLTDLARERDIPVTILRHMRQELSLHRMGEDLLALREIWRWLGSVRPALLHAHSSKAGALGRAAALLRGVPTVFTAHGWAFTEGVPFARKLMAIPVEWLAARFTDAIITVSDEDHDLASRYRIRPRGRMVTIHNGIGREAPRSAQSDDGTVRLLCVARFSPQKSQALLVRALEDVDGPWHLTFVGDGPLEDDVRRLVDDCGLGDRVDFLGSRDDVEAIMARSHVFVLPSNWEGFPLTILEAMRAGLPVVASDVGGVGEAVVDGVTGYLVPRDDVEGLARRLRRLIDDTELRRRFGESARDVFAREFVDEKMFGRVQSLYASLGGARHPRGVGAHETVATS